MNVYICWNKATFLFESEYYTGEPKYDPDYLSPEQKVLGTL